MRATEMASHEQLEAAVGHFTQTAWLASELYKACIAAGLPPELTADIVVDWHREAIRDPGYEDE